MMNSTDPAVARRRLASALRSARQAALLTQERVSAEMGWHESKVRRIEQGKTAVSKNDLRALLILYGQTHRFDDLWATTPVRRDASRWRIARDLVSPEFIRYLEYEESARVIREFQPLILPGLLQTERYARAIIDTFAPHHDEVRKERLLRLRVARQDLWARRPGCHLSVVLDQAAICRWVGGRDVMREQLERLKELNQQRNVSIQVISFDQGAHVGLAGAFSILEFDGLADRVLYLSEQSKETVSVDDPAMIGPYFKDLADLSSMAASPTATDLLIDARLEQLNRT